MGKAIIRDTETNEELTLRKLQEEYRMLKNSGATEAETFEDYLETITEPNGTCEWCGELFSRSELREEVDLGLLCDRCIAGIASRGEELTLKY